MTNRRLFLQAGTLSSFCAISSVARAAPATPPPKTSTSQGYALTNGASARKRKDGTWVFWVRLVNLDQPGATVPANLQIATDRAFQQIVDVLPVTLTAARSFIAQIPYIPRVSNTQLYYRYVIGQSALAAPSVSAVVGSIAPWDNESRMQ